MVSLPRSAELLNRNDSRVLLVDLQERLMPVIAGGDVILDQCEKLVRGAAILGVPVTATEQYPKGLGPTVARLAELVADRPEKIEFSCLNCLPWNSESADTDHRFRIVVAGIETHVCVLQTVLDLLSHGFSVSVLADAVSSRNPLDREIALQRMANCGATITTVESVLFEWCQQAGTAEFKEISRLVK